MRHTFESQIRNSHVKKGLSHIIRKKKIQINFVRRNQKLWWLLLSFKEALSPASPGVDRGEEISGEEARRTAEGIANFQAFLVRKSGAFKEETTDLLHSSSQQLRSIVS